MSNVELTGLQRELLTVLVNEYQQTDDPVGSERLAEALDRAPGTIQNTMQRLTDVGVVEGVPGPGGGYAPTEVALAVLGREDLEESASVSLARDFERVTVTIDEITFRNVTRPDTCHAHVHCLQSVEPVSIGDPIVVGPTPQSNLVVAGEIEHVNATADSFLLDVAHVEAPLTEE